MGTRAIANTKARSLALSLLALWGCFDGKDGAQERATSSRPDDSSATHTASEGPHSDPEARCSAPKGSYRLRIDSLDGACEALTETTSLSIEGTPGTQRVVVRRLDDTLTVDLTVRECELSIGVTAVPEGTREPEALVIAGTRMVARAEGSYRGEATGTRKRGGEVTCSGRYSLLLEPSDSPPGGAASGEGDGASGGQSFAAAHGDQIADDCTQTVACMQQLHQLPSGDPFDSCVSATSQALDRGSEQTRARFLAARQRCDGLTACDYVGCASHD